jgi:uncharacterized protein (TIGR02598 family)
MARAGFSLIEITLALGVLSFALVAMMGLIPVGLTTLRGAVDASTMARITQQISSQARMTSFTNLPARFANREFYFDENGDFLTNSPAPPPTEMRYWAVTALADATFPGSTNILSPGTLANSVQAISVRIISAPSYTAATRTTNSQNLLIPNSGF